MRVKVREVTRREGLFTVIQSGLGIAVFADADDVPADLVDGITAPVLKWKKKRGDKTYALSLTFSAAREMHPAIEAALFQLYKRERFLQHAMDRTGSISVTLCDEQGTATRSYGLNLLSLLQGKYHRIETPVEPEHRPAKSAPAHPPAAQAARQKSGQKSK